ncbi:hypothetical protein OBBRIDRAFT_787783 [Obba rivulosa]|uniref:Uncharacterized protein n=1 Tax=Obba rivulosa TaxID=1052685 RepID=A0A8E2DUM4_9APHY|nr:hypothetical protein OBBRIDRAFT_787783 [Obba rivulosa]
MGRWTLEHHDDVLLSKLKSLVMGAVKRAKLEKGEPSITYETFVQELDEGDSFTTSLIDVLVKEMAERRTRPNVIDRRLISERTAKYLRLQASPLHIYRGRSAQRARRVFARPDELQSSSGEDEFASVPEGTRVNTELYEAYAPTSLDILSSLRSSEPSPLATGSPAVDWVDVDPEAIAVTSPRPSPPPVLPSIAYRTIHASSAHGGNTTVGSSLTRQNSTRRPARSRTVDFNEFTSRRRSSSRQDVEVQDGSAADRADGSWRFDTVDFSSRREESSADTSSHPQPARRFFPFRTLPAVRRRSEVSGALPWTGDSSQPYNAPEPSWPYGVTSAAPWPTPVNAPASATSPPVNSLRAPSSSEVWSSLFSQASSRTGVAPPRLHSRSPSPAMDSLQPTPSTSSLLSDRRHTIVPRLRRGGIQPPESMLSRHASPPAETQHARAQALSVERPEPVAPAAALSSESAMATAQAAPEALEPVSGLA